ncbi:helix-turn-helix transcriptional regulator [Tychonema sp. LEGE 07199]|uniref:helix-turn-helix transcriptional regulator n=1 Tax=unclassified Tychonema TaxID=2642144 RepID=UPI00187EC0D9|nr:MULTISPECIES: helix-turn-helix transcriptional regulator [unclassified Tychonema]MBE9121964.1 helix-turn-helix transcriptional regulator [Tychonema sp. LEGE 07199]MBE9131301.1 helix-turn-helix transcriptional regulator [Tychonema sp. LEGE 07196]
MDAIKRQCLEAAGWRVGDAADFLELSAEEIAFIEMKLSLIKPLKQLRITQNLSQESLAKKIKSSQSRVAKIESGDPSVSLDLMVRTMLALGATREDVALAIASSNVIISSKKKHE